LIQQIAKTAEFTPYDWKLVKNIVIIFTKDILIQMQAQYADCKSTPGESFDE